MLRLIGLIGASSAGRRELRWVEGGNENL